MDYSEHLVYDAVSEEVETGQRILVGCNKTIADHMLIPLKERGHHFIGIFGEVGPVAVKHEDIGAGEEADAFNDCRTFSFALLNRDFGTRCTGNLQGIIRTVTVHYEDVGIPHLHEFLHKAADSRLLVQGRNKDTDLITINSHYPINLIFSFIRPFIYQVIKMHKN